MREVWLKANPRIAALGAAISLVNCLIWASVLAITDSQAGRLLAGVGLSLGVFSLILIALVWRQPRLAYDGRSLLAYLNGARPIRVPIEIVECFLLGHGPALLPGEKHAKTETATLVVKLADRAEDWAHVAVDPRLASWCDGYIKIRGTWTEPLNLGVVQRLNERLAAVSQLATERSAR